MPQNSTHWSTELSSGAARQFLRYLAKEVEFKDVDGKATVRTDAFGVKIQLRYTDRFGYLSIKTPGSIDDMNHALSAMKDWEKQFLRWIQSGQTESFAEFQRREGAISGAGRS